jgi:hypothetical protein
MGWREKQIPCGDDNKKGKDTDRLEVDLSISLSS